MIPSSTSPEAAADWKHSLRRAWRDPVALLASLGLDGMAASLDHSNHFPFLVTREFAARMRAGDPDDPLLRQVLPALAELIRCPGSLPIQSAIWPAGATPACCTSTVAESC